MGLLVRVGEAEIEPGEPRDPAPAMDMSASSADSPVGQPRLLFIHHSVGGQWFADPGPDDGGNSIHETYPNGGGLRGRLRDAGYDVHEASYGSQVGDLTDMRDWLPKFRDQMDAVLRTSHQDETYDGDARNQIVMFKSCYPANDFYGIGEAPGDPTSHSLTVWNAKAALSSLLPHFAAHPEVLFVYITAPPLSPRVPGLRVWRHIMGYIKGNLFNEAHLRESSRLARQFNDWVISPDGWLRDYEHKNVVAYDYFDALTGHGRFDVSLYPTDRGYDPHPSSEGQNKAAEEFVPFLNRAVHRWGILESTE